MNIKIIEKSKLIDSDGKKYFQVGPAKFYVMPKYLDYIKLDDEGNVLFPLLSCYMTGNGIESDYDGNSVFFTKPTFHVTYAEGGWSMPIIYAFEVQNIKKRSGLDFYFATKKDRIFLFTAKEERLSSYLYSKDFYKDYGGHIIYIKEGNEKYYIIVEFWLSKNQLTTNLLDSIKVRVSDDRGYQKHVVLFYRGQTIVYPETNL